MRVGSPAEVDPVLIEALGRSGSIEDPRQLHMFAMCFHKGKEFLLIEAP
jgi:hypothetical protein